MQDVVQTYQESSALERAAIKVFSYRQQFPDSEISTDCLIRYLLRGGSIDMKTGALFNPKMARPDPEMNNAQEDDDRPTEQTVSVGELVDAGISFQMRADEQKFNTEVLRWHDPGQGPRDIRLFSDIRGVFTTEKRDTEIEEIFEPLTKGEAYRFIVGMMEPQAFSTESGVAFVAQMRARDAVVRWAETLNIQGVNSEMDKFQIMLETAVDKANDEPDSVPLPLRDILERARTTARRRSIGEMWSYCGAWCIGERQGVTYGREHENDQRFSKQRQFAQRFERVDGELDFNDELDRSRNMNLFHELYTNRKYNRENDSWTAVQAADGGPVNAGHADRSVYLLRQELRREEFFAKKLWRFYTWPLAVVEAAMKRIETEYRESIKKCAPGPGRKRTENLNQRELQDLVKLGWFDPNKDKGRQWVNVPLYGRRAVEWLRSRGELGRLAGKPVHRDIRVLVGERWNQTLMRREHIDALRETLQWRRQRPHYEGLPLSYIKRRYC